MSLLSGGLARLKLCGAGSRHKPLNLCRWNNHAVWSRLVSRHSQLTNARNTHVLF